MLPKKLFCELCAHVHQLCNCKLHSGILVTEVSLTVKWRMQSTTPSNSIISGSDVIFMNSNDTEKLQLRMSTSHVWNRTNNLRSPQPYDLISVAEKSLISKKSIFSWYIFITFVLQNVLIGYAWYYMSSSQYHFVWILLSIQCITFMYYPFYADIILNVRIPFCNNHRTSMRLWKLCLIIECTHIAYLLIINGVIPCLCVIEIYVANVSAWCPINASLIFQQDKLWMAFLAIIGVSFGWISVLVLLYLIYLDTKLYKIWTIQGNVEHKSGGYLSRKSISSRNVSHTGIPISDPYNVEMKESSTYHDSDSLRQL